MEHGYIFVAGDGAEIYEVGIVSTSICLHSIQLAEGKRETPEEQIRGDSTYIEKAQKEHITDEVRLGEHFYELETMAIKIADIIEKLVNYEESLRNSPSFILKGERLYREKGMLGNIVRGGHVGLCRDQEGQLYDLPLLRIGWKPVDSTVAAYLLEHLNYRFPELACYENWDEVNLDNVQSWVVDKLRLLVHTKNFGICPTCPICSGF